MKKHLKLTSRLIVLIVLSAILLSFTGCESKINSSTPTPAENNVSDGDWETIDNTDSLLGRTMTTDYGRQYTYIVNFIDLKDKVSESQLSKESFAVFSKWALSVLTFDMNIHTPLFTEKHLENKLYSEFVKTGYDKDDAVERITRNANILLPYKKVEFNATITGFIVNDSDAVNEVLTYNNMFSEYNMDREKLGDVFSINADGIIFIDETFYYDISEIYEELNDIIVFEYDGKMYMHFQYLDDDLALDILQGNIDENKGVFELEQSFGKVTKTEKDFFYLEDSRHNMCCFSKTDAVKNIELNVGDDIKVQYYDLSIPVKLLIDDTKCRYLVAVEISVE